jgi:hypothetical protein
MKQGVITEEQYFLLSRESALAALSIGHGLTLIRKYDFVKHGFGSQSFFMLSIGIERLLKLVIIYDYFRTHNNQFPDNSILKKAGHNIKALYVRSLQIAEDIGEMNLHSKLLSDPIYNIIIDFLTDFASVSRYYNLDTLTGRPNVTGEPLREWNRKINSIIIERHYRHNAKKAEAIKTITDIMQPHVLVSFDDEEGMKINDIKQFYLDGMKVDVKQKYSMFYVFCIVRFLSYLIAALDKGFYPSISEYFILFRNTDDAYVRRLKVWNLYGL